MTAAPHHGDHRRTGRFDAQSTVSSVASKIPGGTAPRLMDATPRELATAGGGLAPAARA
ncbi:hypothetical protein H7H78_16995 [Mycobacterium shinjukuense]|nr:hypothetical protein [Mycobacterium shinjukuense]MCV6987051.1 hypothetical protein [Mycobacterium shinjukuense]